MTRHLFAISALLILVIPAYSQITSKYSSLDERKCKTLELNQNEGGWYRGRCPGVAGYKLEVVEGDLRQSINVIVPGNKIYDLELMNVSGAFSHLGPRAEWRMKGKKPTALIVRFNANENPEDPSKITSYLVVAKITNNQICVTDVLTPGPSQNTEARLLADNAPSRPCKFSN